MYLHQLGSEWIPALPDVHQRLQTDPPARIADVGCGSGWSTLMLARAYPKAQVEGIDIDAASIAAAQRNAEQEGSPANVHFTLANAGDPGLQGTFDFACAFECIHDMAQPVEALRAMRELVGDGGTVLIGDERVAEQFTAPGDDLERLMYGYSVLHCLPVGMVDRPSAETGTMMRPATLERYALEAGFRNMEILPVENDLWRFYRLNA
jgi:2-polyprenyl-3-methyl-5-hydroxy-6-metoxy-1,4-benzoquinol methylase